MKLEYKLFTCKDGGQVLLSRDYDEDEEEAPHKIVMVTNLEGVRATISLSFKTESEEDGAFENYDQDSAERYRGSMLKQFEQD